MEEKKRTVRPTVIVEKHAAKGPPIFGPGRVWWLVAARLTRPVLAFPAL